MGSGSLPEMAVCEQFPGHGINLISLYLDKSEDFCFLAYVGFRATSVLICAFKGKPCTFQQDNVKQHTASMTATWLCSSRVQVFN